MYIYNNYIENRDSVAIQTMSKITLCTDDLVNYLT